MGTAALFLNNMDDAIACQDKAGAATGIPDLAIVTTEVSQQCSPVTFGVNPPQLDCSTKDAHPQTFRANQGTVKYYQRAINKKLHGAFVYSNDLKSAAVGGLSLARGAQAGGVKSDGETGHLRPRAAVGVHTRRSADEGRGLELRAQQRPVQHHGRAPQGSEAPGSQPRRHRLGLLLQLLRQALHRAGREPTPRGST